jgi:hypothetical protein
LVILGRFGAFLPDKYFYHVAMFKEVPAQSSRNFEPENSHNKSSTQGILVDLKLYYCLFFMVFLFYLLLQFIFNNNIRMENFKLGIGYLRSLWDNITRKSQQFDPNTTDTGPFNVIKDY